MRKLAFFLLAVVNGLLLSCNTECGTTTAAGGDARSLSVLKFNGNGKFKIVQFTDIHFNNSLGRSDSTLVLMRKVLGMEKPDLVVLTGDVVTAADTKNGWLKVTKVLIDAKVPWAVSLGNHDAQFELSKEEIIHLVSSLPYCVTVAGPKEVLGCGNYVLGIEASSSRKIAALCYVFDSQMYDGDDYAWITFSQIKWYREQSDAFKEQNNGEPLPALAFFHIPLPEYKEVRGIGIFDEKVCSPVLNSGLFTSMVECKEVMGVFVGHDHDNNYIGCLRDICLAYGSTSGRSSYGHIGRGARVIELYEGQRRFDSWILKLYDYNRDTEVWTPSGNDEPRFFVSYPDSFVEPTEASK